MTFVCLWSPAWRTGAGSSTASDSAPPPPDLVALAATLLTSAPRVAVDVRGGRSVVWADARGMNARVLAHALLDLLTDDGVADPCAGVAAIPIAAELAAVRGTPGVTVVEPGGDRAFVAPFPVTALELSPRLATLLAGVGVSQCGDLAALTRESVEVRFGAEGVTPWRHARADDDRAATIFPPMPRALPHATLEWMDYEVTDPARLLFVINALLENVCDALAATGQGARELVAEFALANREVHREVHREPFIASRPTASRRTWARLARAALDRVVLSSAVTGIALRATRIAECEVRQGDLFDRGLASAEATEQAVARLIEDQGNVVVTPHNSAHPLVEHRTEWRAPAAASPAPPALHVRRGGVLTLQLSPEPRAIAVETALRRDHFVPVRFRDASGWHDVVHVAGPDRVSGGVWDAARAYAREYFRCVTAEGVLVWLFRAAHGRESRWYAHGWWD